MVKIYCVSTSCDLVDILYWEESHQSVYKPLSEEELDKMEVMRLMNQVSEVGKPERVFGTE